MSLFHVCVCVRVCVGGGGPKLCCVKDWKETECKEESSSMCKV